MALLSIGRCRLQQERPLGPVRVYHALIAFKFKTKSGSPTGMTASPCLMARSLSFWSLDLHGLRTVRNNLFGGFRIKCSHESRATLSIRMLTKPTSTQRFCRGWDRAGSQSARRARVLQSCPCPAFLPQKTDWTCTLKVSSITTDAQRKETSEISCSPSSWCRRHSPKPLLQEPV